MSGRFRIRVLDVLVLAGFVGAWAAAQWSVQSVEDADPRPFVRQVRLDPLYRTAVQADGRLRSFESHARTFMGYVAGRRSVNGQSNGFTYLDLIFRPDAYDDVDLIYIKNKNVVLQILDALKGSDGIDEARAARILKRKMISRHLLLHPEVRTLLRRLGEDLLRTAKSVDAIQGGLGVSDGRFLLDSLRMVAPPDGRIDRPWLSLGELVVATGVPRDDVHSTVAAPRPIDGIDPGFQRDLTATWSALREAWRAEDAAAVNEQVARLAGLVPTVSPENYPSARRLSLESWYFRSKSMTWVWLVYLASVIPLLMSVIYRWDRARTIGMGLFVVAFGCHTASLAVRWYISSRWPNSNMFEAVTTSAWFGGVGALVLEWLTRRSPIRSLFALGSAVMSMAALMAAYYLPAQLDSTIGNKMAALNDVWLYIHTNMIIWSYAVIGLACVPALLQLRHRWCLAWDEGTIPPWRLCVLPVNLVILHVTGYLLLMHALDDPSRDLAFWSLCAVLGAFGGSSGFVVTELAESNARRRVGRGRQRAATGGASSLILGASPGSSFLRDERPTTSQVFDGATMVLVELAFVMLWTGVVMGAIWADHSWGRPWGWDPKEVFALNTFIVFIVLIHVRMKVRDKSFWTAVLAIVGFEVMMFNWLAVNFVITGLHSYA